MNRDFLSFADLKPAEVLPILERARALKQGKKSNSMVGRHAVLLFEKPSLRTKLSFWVGVEKLGGKPVYFSPEEVGLGKREPVEHVAQVVSRMADVAIVRTFAHSTLEKFAAASSVPVINALTDAEHPCQALADILTIYEHRLALDSRRPDAVLSVSKEPVEGSNGGQLKGAKVAYIGDGNNVAVSLAYAVAFTGGRFVIASPKGYELPAGHAKRAQAAAKAAGGSVTQLRSPQEAVNGADFVYTDVWTGMGQEAETAIRKNAFAGYQVDPALMKLAGRHAKFMHDMPAHPGEEVSPGMLEQPSSIVFDQAGNRLWAQAALLDAMFSKE